jgi:regulator of replication initiation timing
MLINNLNNLQNDLVQSSIEKEKLNNEVNHLKERLEEVTRVFSEKGSANK